MNFSSSYKPQYLNELMRSFIAALPRVRSERFFLSISKDIADPLSASNRW